ncbi:ABC transporter permease [Paenibacillus arenilitoris]
MIAKRDLVTRYNNTYLGFFWTLLQPLFLGGTYYYVFKYISKIEIPNFFIFLLAGLFPWVWLQSGIAQSCGSVIGNTGIVKKVKFNRSILPMATIVQTGVHFLLCFLILVIFMLFNGYFPRLNWVIYIPVLLVQQFLLMLGISFIVSSANVIYRDLDYIITTMLSILFFFTPIGYSIENVPESIEKFVSLNPFTGLIEGWRSIILFNESPVPYLLIPFLFSLLFLLIGYFIYNKIQKDFSELL